MNPVDIEEAVSALAAEPFDREEFPYRFLQAFGNKDTTIKRLRKGETNQSDIDVSQHQDIHSAILQRNNIHLAVCVPGAVTA